MSTGAIHNSASAAPAEEGRAANPAPARPAQPAPTAADSVHLTEAQQVYQLHNQGQRVSQIASSLNLTVAAVNNYLNVSNSNSKG